MRTRPDFRNLNLHSHALVHLWKANFPNCGYYFIQETHISKVLYWITDFNKWVKTQGKICKLFKYTCQLLNLGWDLIFCISNKPSVAADTAAPRTGLELKHSREHRGVYLSPVFTLLNIWVLCVWYITSLSFLTFCYRSNNF